MTKFNMAEEVAKIMVDERVRASESKAPKVRNGLSPTRDEYARLDTILCTQRFKFNDLSSVLQKKELMRRKLALLERLCTEEALMEASYTEVLNGLQQDIKVRQLMNSELSQEEHGLDKVLVEMDQANYIGNQRDYALDLIHLDTRKKIKKERVKLEDLLKERQVTLRTEEEQSQRVLYDILQHTRRIKVCKEKLSMLEK